VLKEAPCEGEGSLTPNLKTKLSETEVRDHLKYYHIQFFNFGEIRCCKKFVEDSTDLVISHHLLKDVFASNMA
jgi:hypothetical protein